MVRVSVIVPVYKAERYLDICLDSIINQSFQDFEILCINDGSPDNCINILRQYANSDKRIKIFSQKNTGFATAKNLGINYAKGEFIIFVDGNDFLSPVALERMCNNITEHMSDFSFSYIYQQFPKSVTLLEKPNIKEFTQKFSTPFFNEQELDAEFYLKFVQNTKSKIYRKNFIKEFLFVEDLAFEDIPFFANCYLNADRISFDIAPLYFYRQFENSPIYEETKKYLDIFKINDITTKIFEKKGKLDKYKTSLLVSQMENTLLNIMSATGIVKRKMFDKMQETYKNLDFSSYDLNVLKRKNIYYAFQEILNKDYQFYKRFESKVKNDK